MLPKIIDTVAIVLFVVGVVGVLQGWSKSSTVDHLIGIAFTALFGIAAAWGVRTLFGIGH